jgi:beta-1,2-mannobiose phosphorylase / 1,2-beta-oligomannan phosphorylase
MIPRCTPFWASLGLLALLAAPSPPPAPTQVRPTPQQAFPSWPLVRWTPIPENPVFTGTGRDTWDRKIRERGYILANDDGNYDLWYTGYAGDRPATMSLGHATSRDGIRWTRDPANPIFTESWVEDMCVVHRDGAYVMVAEGKNDVAHLLTSTDGRKWTDHGSLDIRKTDGKPVDPGPYGTPTAWFENGTWYLYYERGDQGIWLAVSKDLKVWTNVQDDPVIAMGPEPYDKTAVALNQVVKRNGLYYAFYHANSNRPWKNWTTCVARSRDLIHWEKYPGNPIIENNCSSAILVQTPHGEDRLYTMHPDVKVFVPK